MSYVAYLHNFSHGWSNPALTRRWSWLDVVITFESTPAQPTPPPA